MQIYFLRVSFYPCMGNLSLYDAIWCVFSNRSWDRVWLNYNKMQEEPVWKTNDWTVGRNHNNWNRSALNHSQDEVIV